MSKQLQPGMRCLVTGAFHNTENIGKTVVLQRVIAPGEKFLTDDGRSITNGSTMLCWLITGNGLHRRRILSVTREPYSEFGVCALCEPKFLMPLDGGEDLQETEQQDQPVDTGVTS